MVPEIYKTLAHGGLQPGLFHYREARGPEIDLIIEAGHVLAVVAIKSGATIQPEFFKNLKYFSTLVNNVP